MEHLNADQAARLLGDKIKPHVAILLIVGRDKINNATASFISTGSENLIVTCAHVVHSFREMRENDPNLFMALGGGGHTGVLKIRQEWLIDCYEGTDLKIDLATYRFPDIASLTVFGKSCYLSSSWPPVRPCEGELAVIAGFPGDHRQQREGKMIANINVIADPITSVQDTHFTLADEHQERTMVKLNKSLGNLGEYGGMSGSAAYVFGSDGEPRLVGFFDEAHVGVNAIIRVTHASLIRKDGKLDRSLVPI